MLSTRTALGLLRLASCALPLVGTSACAVDGPHAEAVGSEGASLLGGELDTGDPSVVAINIFVPGDGSREAMCTGTVVGPRTVLTAAHCVDARVVGSGNVFEIVRGPARDSGVPVRAESSTFDHAFDPSNPRGGHDVGLLTFPTDLGLAPVAYGAQPTPLPVRLVGYGASHHDNSGAGIKRATFAAVETITDHHILTGTSDQQTCHGDSGGPVLQTVNGVETIVGITSFGDDYSDTDVCYNGGWSVRVDNLMSFIDGARANALAVGNRFFPMDVDGDGRKDMVIRFGDGGWEVRLSNGHSFEYSYSFSSPFSDAAGWSTGNRFYPMDINGDGKDDMVIRDPKGVFEVRLSNGHSFEATTYSFASPFDDRGGWNAGNHFYPMDINGDGKDDMTIRYPNGGFQVRLSDGYSFDYDYDVPSPFTDADGWWAGNHFYPMDINGDGRDDMIVRYSNGGWQVRLSDGHGFDYSYDFLSRFSDADGWWAGNHFYPMDINGDGRDDMVIRFPDGGFEVRLSNGTSFDYNYSFPSRFSDMN